METGLTRDPGLVPRPRDLLAWLLCITIVGLFGIYLWNEMRDYRFMRYAIYAGLLAAVAFGIIGTYVVVRRIVFISGGIAHASFGGVGLAFYMGWDPILGAALFALASALGIGILSKETLEREETTIGIIWAVGMAMGAFFIRITPGYPPNPASYLFGNILMLQESDINLLVCLAAAILVSMFLLYNRIQATAFDEEFSRVAGVHTLTLHLFFLVLVALTIVLLIKFMGIILVLAMLTIPSSIVGQFTHDMRRIMFFSTLLSAFFVLTGLWLSYELNYETGATIVIEAALAYLGVIFTTRVVKASSARRSRKKGSPRLNEA